MTPSLWQELTRRVRDSATFRELLDAPEAHIVRLPTRAAAWVLGEVAHARNEALLVVVANETEAIAWSEASRVFGRPCAYLPAPALTPYQRAKASLQTRALDTVALDDVEREELPAAVCSARALFRRLPDPDAFAERVHELTPESDVDLELLCEQLVRNGYRRSDLVVDVGVFAVRGGVVDVFPPGYRLPVRVDLFGDTVESLQHFDIATQRSLEPLERVRIRPLSLFESGAEDAAELADALLEEVTGEEARLRAESLLGDEPFDGWQRYLPLVQPSTSLAGWLPPERTVVMVDSAAVGAEIEHYEELLAAELVHRLEAGDLAIEPSRLLLPVREVNDLRDEVSVTLGEDETTDAGLRAGGADTPLVLDFAATQTDLLVGQLPRFPREIETAKGRDDRLIIVGASSQQERLRNAPIAGKPLGDYRGVEFAEGELERGFRLPAAGVVLYTEAQLFGERRSTGTSRKTRPFLSGLRDLKVGEYVVHDDHGIGRFIGMRTLDAQQEKSPDPWAEAAATAAASLEVMEIQYGGERTLLLPLSRLDQIQRYSGVEGVAPRLDKLGGSSWSKRKSRVRSGLKKLATDLLKLYAQRKLARATAMGPDTDAQDQFEIAFEHDETADQLESIRTIKEDLERERPMDRLLCGDVGFGKTEVAIRAAHKVVDNGYQVAVLAPTTILADQHLRTFKRRFAGTKARIELISRSRTSREMREIRERILAGEIDIVIGTHRLLGRDIEIPLLALVIVDEEQRFGVGQKEKLKELRHNVHMLAMSATPVPRTLQLSLAGVRDLSVIESPPRDRMSIETRIAPFDRDLIREAVEFELERGGQVFYVYNRVEDIERIQAFLQETIPGLRMTVGHGQLEERELAARMRAFTAGEFDLLLATTIIENGIDIPNVNTILVHRSDTFGLAQLYQLRGRVGRSQRLGYCYLLVPSDRVLSEEARKRLAAIREFTELGAGFRIAARDLEIRGAGNLLGAEQSGHIVEVGIETYLKMLEDTVRELRGEEPIDAPSANIDLPVAMSIPTDYVAEANLRMEIYRRLGASEQSSEAVLAELRDRFGPPPREVETLVSVFSLKRLAEHLRVQSVSLKGRQLVLRLRRDARVDVDRLIQLVSVRDGTSFSPTGVLTIDDVPASESLGMARELLQQISGPQSASEPPLSESA